MKPFKSLTSLEPPTQPKPSFWTVTKFAVLISVLAVAAIGGGLALLAREQITKSSSSTSTFKDYSVSAPAPGSALVGSPSSTIVTITTTTGFAGLVSLTVNPVADISCDNNHGTFSTTVSVPDSFALTCSTTTQGSYSIYITASSGSISHSIIVQFMFSLRTTELTVSCNPSSLSQGQRTSSCTAIVVDTSSSPMMLTGSVAFSYNSSSPYFPVPCPSGSGDCYADATSCALVSTATCSVQFGSSNSSSPAPTAATYIISAFYFGDRYHAASQRQTDLTVK